MNNKGKKIFVHSSSLVDLKAEVLKKRELLTQAKLLRNQTETPGVNLPAHRSGPTKLKKIFEENVQKKNMKRTNVIEVCDRADEEETLRNSRLALERKAKLYEKMTSGEHIPAEEEGELYLVNFEKKIVDTILQQKAESKEKQEEEEAANVEKEPEPMEEPDLGDIPLPPEPENQWVEYIDHLGNVKSCLQKDLEFFTSRIKQDDSTRERVVEKVEEEFNDPEDDDAPVYYQKMKENEIRLHGVGYFGFSVNPQEREAQMEALNKLREQTLTQRDNRAKLKEKRKAILKERLAKIKKRKHITTDDIEESNSEDSDAESAKEDAPKESEIDVEAVKETEKDLQRKIHLRPWDKGKNLTETNRQGFLSKEAKTLASHFKWIEDRRNERNGEFAPPGSYTGS